MITIKKKMLLYTVLISILPIIILGTFYYRAATENTKNKVNQSSLETFTQIDKSIQIKTNNIHNSLEMIFSNKRVHEILRNTNFNLSNSETFTAVRELDSIFSQFFINEERLEGVVLFSTNGGAYTNNCYLKNANIVSFTMKYGKADETPGKLTWLGSYNDVDLCNSDSNILLVGSVIKDTAYVKDQKNLASVYLMLKNDYFEENVGGYKASLSVFDESGKIVLSNGNNVLDSIWSVSVETGRKIFESAQGDFQTKIGDENYVLTHYTSPQLGWKYVRIVEENEYFKELWQINVMTTLTVILLLAVAFLVNYIVVNKITAPIEEIIYAMKEVGQKNFDISMNVYSEDEFGMISTGFNIMVSKINELFHEVVEKEEKRKQADILALQYQITPHFLYNTLSSIRFFALLKDEKEISDMLLIMGRFLRSTINNAGRLVSVEEEIKNIKDYISLYQIRYDNKITSKTMVSDAVLSYYMPAMIIQPIVENAIIHGLNPRLQKNEHAELLLEIEEKEEKLHIVVSDNGIGMRDDEIENLYIPKNAVGKSLHIGIANIVQRIHDMFGSEYGVIVKSSMDTYTKVEIILPKLLENNRK